MQCAACLVERRAEEFSNNQWFKGRGVARCMDCVHWRNGAPATNQNFTRVCAACDKNLDIDWYSSNQLRKGTGGSRCKDCVSDGCWSTEDLQSGERLADVNRVDVNYNRVFARGTSRDCYLGTCTGGRRTGQSIVAKFSRMNPFDESEVDLSITIARVAADIVKSFNHLALSERVIKVNIPSSFSRGNQFFVVEAFIQNFMKFNSNSGWVNGNVPARIGAWNDVMQALSHFSYHTTGGQRVLCDLQGGLFLGGAYLTDPVILSRHRQFGSTDLGTEGIENFFAHHQCTAYCSRSWAKPKSTRFLYPVREGTTAENIAVYPSVGRNFQPGLAVISDDEYCDSSDEDFY